MNILKQFGINSPKTYIDFSMNTSEQPELVPEKSCIFKSKITCFIDGSCTNNGKLGAVAGYAAVFPDYPDYDISEPLTGKIQTNNRAEFTAFIRAAQQADVIDPSNNLVLDIYTDSELLVKSITKWLPGWKRSNFIKSDNKPVLNKDLLLTIDNIISKRKVKWNHVRAHTGKQDYASIYNDKADRLAKEATKYKNLLSL
ncbi:MAG: hypothetical protein EBU66_20215 [Bacteroidetes bacterium]|nr:hypothetical protein [bacterium]NBP66957.1 hypothetical protein [Bacteroidota bacterium]